MYTILKCGNMSFSVTMDDQSFDESIACNEGVDEEVDDGLRYHIHVCMTIDRLLTNVDIMP